MHVKHYYYYYTIASCYHQFNFKQAWNNNLVIQHINTCVTLGCMGVYLYIYSLVALA